jgi:hypothetical protein
VPKNHISSFDPGMLPVGSFPSLGLLDLADNRLEVEDDIMAFVHLAELESVRHTFTSYSFTFI